MLKYFITMQMQLETLNGVRSTKQKNVTSGKAKELFLLLAISITKIIARKFCQYFVILH